MTSRYTEIAVKKIEINAVDRDINAAINIATQAVAVASDTGETENARDLGYAAPVEQRRQVIDTGRPHHTDAATSAEQSTDHPGKAVQRLLPLVSLLVRTHAPVSPPSSISTISLPNTHRLS